MVKKKELDDILVALRQRVGVLDMWYGDSSRPEQLNMNFNITDIKNPKIFHDIQDDFYEIMNRFYQKETVLYKPGFFSELFYLAIDNTNIFFDVSYVFGTPVNLWLTDALVAKMKNSINNMNMFQLDGTFKIYKFKPIIKQLEGYSLNDSFSIPEVKELEDEQEDEQEEWRPSFLIEGQELYNNEPLTYSESVTLGVNYYPNREQIKVDEEGNWVVDENGEYVMQPLGDFEISVKQVINEVEYVYIINGYPYSLDVSQLLMADVGYYIVDECDNIEEVENKTTSGTPIYFLNNENIQKMKGPSFFSDILNARYEEEYKIALKEYTEFLDEQLKNNEINQEDYEKLLNDFSFVPEYDIPWQYEEKGELKKTKTEINLFQPSGFMVQKKNKGIYKDSKLIYQWNLGIVEPSTGKQSTGKKSSGEQSSGEFNQEYGKKITIAKTKSEILKKFMSYMEGDFMKAKFAYSCSYTINIIGDCYCTNFYGTVQKWKKSFDNQ